MHISVKMKDLSTLSRWCANLGLEISLKLLTNLRSRFLGGGRGSIQKLSFPLQKAIKKGCEGRTAAGFVKTEDFYGLGVSTAIKIAVLSYLAQ